MEPTGWSKDLRVEVGGHGVVSHAGSEAVRLIADGIGLTVGSSRVLSRRGFVAVHDRGRVLVDTAVMIADEGTVMSELATLRGQGGAVRAGGLDPTLWRALSEIGPAQTERIAWARVGIRAHVWRLVEVRHGRIPLSRVADRDLGATIVVRRDASILICHSDKEQAAGTFKHTYGHHPLMAWYDNTGSRWR